MAQQKNWNELKPFYDRFLKLSLSENNAKEAIEIASKFVDVRCFCKNCTRDKIRDVYIKLEKAFNMIGDRGNADKYANEIKKMDEINKVLLSFKDFRKLELPGNNTVNVKEAIKLASAFVENQYFLEVCPKKIRNDIYAKLAKAYYLNGDYENAYKYLCKDTCVYYDKNENTVTILHDEWNCSQKDELMGIWEDVRERLYLSEKERKQREAEETKRKKEADFQKILKQKDPNEITRKDLGWLLGEFEYTDLSEDNKKMQKK